MTGKHLQLLGWPCLVTAQGAEALPASRPMQLLAWLAVAGAWQGRDTIARLFWPDSPDKVARSNLRNLLFKTGVAAPWAPLEATEHALRLVMPTDLQQHAAAVQRADWEAVVRLGAQDLLQGFEQQASDPWLRWLDGEREALLAHWRTAAQALLAQSRRPVEQRESLAETWARRCPEDEEAVIARMAVARERGHEAAAQRLYREFEARLQQSFGVRPSRALEQIASRDSPGAAPPDAQARPAQPAHATSPPARPAIFGRRLEMAQLAGLLADESVRLVCLTGPGGVGKSTLLASLRARAVDAGRADVRLVDASAAPSAAAVVAAVGKALGLESLPGPDPVEALAAAVGDMACLLLLDGAEQAGLAAPVARLLDRCPRLRLVVASRVRLHMDQELMLALDGFPLPDADETDADVLTRNDAVSYLAAVMRQDGQAVDLAREAAALGRLARAVDGLPLALKLLARLTRLYTPQQLLDSLRQHDADGSAAESPALGELMPALVASFERSWRALVPLQQAALSRLAVFPAPFDVAAARAVGRASVPVVTSLVDASLLRADGAGLLSLHAAIRACVLHACPLRADVEDDYLDYFVERLGMLARLARSRTARPMRLFLREHATHVHFLWQRALDRRAFGALLATAESLWFLTNGISGEDGWLGAFVQAEALLRDDTSVPGALHALLAAGAARAAHYQGHLDDAARLSRKAIRLGRVVRHHEALVWALDTAIRTCIVQRRSVDAQALMGRIEALLDPDRESGLLTAIVLRLRQMMTIVSADGMPDLSVTDRLEALYERFEDTDELVRVRLARAFAHTSAGQVDRGIEEMEQVAELASQRRADPALQATALCEAAGWLLDQGRVERARNCVARANVIASLYPQAQFMRLKTGIMNAALAVADRDALSAAPRLADVLGAMARGAELPMVGEVFLVAARWFLLLPQRDAAMDLLRAIEPMVWEMRTYEQAQALLQKLAAPGLPRPVVASDTQTMVVAGVARERVLNWIGSSRPLQRAG